jgi:hypothetical protein
VEVHIVRTQEYAGNTWWLFEGWPDAGPVWLRNAADGSVRRYDPETNRETVWADFSRAEGETYETSIGTCNTTAMLSSRHAKHTGPVGEFVEAAIIMYPPGVCRDAGITREVYAAWIGLVQREITTFAGPRTYDLIYARLGGVTVLSEKELAFSVALDAARYRPGAQATARISLRHTQPDPLTVVFSSGQTYDLILRDEAGNEVWRWSQGRVFPQVLRQVEFPSGEKNWMVTFPAPARAGKYTVEAFLATVRPIAYRAGVGFEVTP